MLRHMATSPQEVKWSILLQLAALALAPIVTAIDWSHLKALGPIPKSVVDAIFTLLLVGYFIWKMSRGRNWARITLLVLFLVGLPFSFFYISGRSAILAVISILQGLLQGTGLLLAFRPSANDWFKKPVGTVNT
jgi:hypothetical protein